MLYLLLSLLPFHIYGGFVLVTSLYNETHPERLKEYLTCLKKNLQHPQIDSIHILYDITKDDSQNALLHLLQNKKEITITYITSRPTFHQLFDLCNEFYNNSRVIISNADIYFDSSLKLLKNYDLRDKFLSLTRWDVRGNDQKIPVFREYEGAKEYGADAWIFNTPIRNIDKIGIVLGTWGCDFGIIYQAVKGDLTVLNPCEDIRCCHVHQSNIRHYSTILPNYPRAWVVASTLDDFQGTVTIMKE